MKIVVDTNIVFSAILNSSSRIGNILINSKKHFQLYSCDFLKEEIAHHKPKLIKLTGLSSLDLDEIEALVTANITFVNESLIPKSVLINAEKLVKDIDPNDTVFVAMADFLNANLWSGDRKLITGLRLKNYHNIIETSGLSLLWDDLEN